MAKAKYFPLLQDETDTDSELDIFTAPTKNETRQSEIKKWHITVLIVSFLVLIAIAIAGWAGYKALHKGKKTSSKNVFSDVITNTECGFVKGASIETHHGNKIAYTFKGIPYAKPPIGNLRWSPPVRLSDNNKSSCWNGVYSADTFGSQCMQSGVNDSEDCLYLNVITPTLNKTANLPVLVWIHGGYLLNGNGSQLGYYPDEDFVTDMNVVGVSMNYRLNAFGFLTLKELWKEGSYGNYGLLDQILVLKWIQDNIQNFGGNSNLVTVSGQSSGGTSIFGFLASSLTDGLIHRAIPMSGSGKFEKTYKEAAKDNRVFIDRSNSCSGKTNSTLRDCLLKMQATEVLAAVPQGIYPFWDMDDLIDFPTYNRIDGALVVLDNIIQYKPKDIYKLKRRDVIPVLIGNTAQEVAFGVQQDFTGSNGWNEFYDFLKSRVDPFNNTFISKLWNDLYSNETFSTNHNMSAQLLYETLTTDQRAGCQMNTVAKYYSKSPYLKAYRYVVEHSPHEPGMHISIFKRNVKHAFHAFDSFALFGYKMLKAFGYKPDTKDNEFMKSFRKVFKHFMVHGDLEKFDWKTNKTGVFQHGGQLKIQGDYHERQCLFWNNEKNGFVEYQWIN